MIKSGRFNGLTQNLHRQRLGILQAALLVVVALEDGLGSGQVSTNARSLPATVIAARIALVQLEAVDPVPASIQEGAAEGTHTTVLRVALLHVADGLDELFARHRFAVG